MVHQRHQDAEKIFCCYCGKWIAYPLVLTSEHLVPKSKGGNGTKENRRPCCSKCNNWRGSKSLEHWRIKLESVLAERKGNSYFRQGVLYSKYDLQIMIENIKMIQYYIETAGGKLLKNTHPKKRGQTQFIRDQEYD